jgi:hypothetical protein
MILWTPHCTCAHPDTGARCAGPSSSAAVSCEKLCWLSCCNRQNSAAIAARCYLAATGSDNTRSNRLVGHCWLSEAGMVGPTTPPEQSTPNAPPPLPMAERATTSHGQPRPATASHGLVARFHSSGRWVHAVAWELLLASRACTFHYSPRTQVPQLLSIMLMGVVCGGGVLKPLLRCRVINRLICNLRETPLPSPLLAPAPMQSKERRPWRVPRPGGAPRRVARATWRLDGGFQVGVVACGQHA